MGEAQSQYEKIQKMHIAAFGMNLLTFSNLFRVLEERKIAAKRFQDSKDEKLIELVEYYNQMIKDLIGL